MQKKNKSVTYGKVKQAIKVAIEQEQKQPGIDEDHVPLPIILHTLGEAGISVGSVELGQIVLQMIYANELAPHPDSSLDHSCKVRIVPTSKQAKKK